MAEIYQWFTNELPPIMQMMAGMAIALATFKLLNVGVELVQGKKKESPKEKEEEKTSPPESKDS